MIDAPVTIIGGGMVGLVAATLLAQEKIAVTLVENHPPLLDWDTQSLEPRVSAINAISQHILNKINCWPLLRPTTFSALEKLVVWDSVGGAEIDFDSAQIGAPALGAIVENREIVRVLWQQLQNNAYITVVSQAPVELHTHPDHVDLVLANGKNIHSKVVIGADGAKSWLREQMHSEINEKPYNHSALVAVVHTERAHQHTGWQAFLPEGVLALLPLANAHRCAIVWSMPPERVQQLSEQTEEMFNQAINDAFGLRLGEIRLLSQRQSIPLIMRHVKNYVQPRLALIGDAAHTIHPLAGQGVNLGFMDAACLAQCIIDAQQQHRDIGNFRVLRRYERWRKGDNTLMLIAMRTIKELFNNNYSLLVQARNIGLQCTHKLNPIKNYFMRLAMGEKNDLPTLTKN